MTQAPRNVAPFGEWPSPITSAYIVGAVIGLGQTCVDGDRLIWREQRPTEGGRGALVARGATGELSTLTPDGFNVRTRVHEYGGAAFAVLDGVVWFVNFADQLVYRHAPDAEPVPITPEGFRYADFVVDRRRGRLICVREDHTGDGEPVATIVALPLDPPTPDAGTVLAEGYDFFAAPRLSPDGESLVWLAWRHPNMPWDSTELWSASLDAAGMPVGAHALVANPEEAVQQPVWSPGGTLHVVSDRSGFWNLYAVEDGVLRPRLEEDVEYGQPPWILGISTYTFAADGTLIAARYAAEGTQLVAIDDAGAATRIGDATWGGASHVRATPHGVICRIERPDRPDAIAHVRRDGNVETLRTSSQLDLTTAWFSTPEPITFGTAGGMSAHALFYPPTSGTHSGPDGALPPLLVRCHGGPTASAGKSLDLGIQYWTSRGFAVADVDYRGSTGYGRAFRDALKGKWGIVDVEDACACVAHLVAQKRVDPERVAIDGRSAGGLTTLLALAEPTSPFTAGASYFGVSDLCRLAEDTHKFESRYLEQLIGRWPEDRSVFEARSPIERVGDFTRPTLFLQGDEDRIVPPNQSEAMAASLRARGVPVAYLLFEGEQHGFRQADNIRRAIDAELYFYAQVWRMKLPEALPAVTIDNLDAR